VIDLKVLDNCEYLFDGAAPTTFDSILMLADQSKLDICVILVSHLRWTNLISNGPSLDPLVINFPIYSRHEAMEILSLNFPKDYPLEFYKSFIEIIYDAHQHACKDLRELRYLVDHLFPKYIEPIIKEKGNIYLTKQLCTRHQNYLNYFGLF
jgi:origin recognition complex subunit 5